MNWFYVFFLFFNMFFVGFVESEGGYSRAHFLSYQGAYKKWGRVHFEAKKFKLAPQKERAAMAVDALKKQKYNGQKLIVVRRELGDPNGYFFNDTILAYQIQSYEKTTNESWQLVFIPDVNNSSLTGAVKIHKKCCYR